MIKVEHSIIVGCSVEKVFLFLSNFEHEPRWQAGILETRQMPEGSALLGTTLTQVRHFLGRRLDYRGEVIEYRENEKIRIKSISGPYPLEGGYAVEPVDGGTRVSFFLSVQPSGVLRFTQSMVARELKKQMETDSCRLKDLLEA